MFLNVIEMLTFSVFCSSKEPDHELFLVYGKGRPGIIRGMDMNAKVPDEYMIPIENLMNPRALDFHAASEFIYFADATSYIIGRQKIDGTERDTILKDGNCDVLPSYRNWKLFLFCTFLISGLRIFHNSLTLAYLRYSHGGGDSSRLDGRKSVLDR